MGRAAQSCWPGVRAGLGEEQGLQPRALPRGGAPARVSPRSRQSQVLRAWAVGGKPCPDVPPMSSSKGKRPRCVLGGLDLNLCSTEAPPQGLHN